MDIARGLGKRTVAEMVGDQPTLDLLAGLGVDHAQGYHIGKPAPLALWLVEEKRKRERKTKRHAQDGFLRNLLVWEAVLWVVLTITVSLVAGVAAERRYGERASATARTMLKVLLYGFTPPVAFLNIVGLEITGDVGGGILIGWAALILAGVLAWAFGRHVLRPESRRPTACS